MKDGRTHMAYKAENTVDLHSDLIVSADVYHGDHADNDTVTISVVNAQKNLLESGSETEIDPKATRRPEISFKESSGPPSRMRP